MSEELPTFKLPPPPRKGGKLLSATDDWPWNARLGADVIPSFYIEGYGIAAKKLMDSLREPPVGMDVHFLVYPIVFLHRQHIELSLKDILHTFFVIGHRDTNFPQHHRIRELWQEVKPIFETQMPSVTGKDDLDGVEDTIFQLADVDPESVAFRYPNDKKGQPTLSRLEHVNLLQLEEKITPVVSWLDAVRSYLSDYRSDLASLDH